MNALGKFSEHPKIFYAFFLAFLNSRVHPCIIRWSTANHEPFMKSYLSFCIFISLSYVLSCLALSSLCLALSPLAKSSVFTVLFPVFDVHAESCLISKGVSHSFVSSIFSKGEKKTTCYDIDVEVVSVLV